MAAPYGEQKTDISDSNDCDRFRNEFKKYKQRTSPLNKSEIIDFDITSPETNVKISAYSLHCPSCQTIDGLKPVSEWKAYSFIEFPGFVVIQDPFEKGCQRRWVNRCLRDYPKSPNVTNLHAHRDMSHVDNIWDNSQSLPGGAQLTKDSLFMKLRWVTLGYHYDWNNKKYHRDKYTPIPRDLADLSTFIAATVGFQHFTPEASIINYYHFDSTLGPHTDHSEFDNEAPIISFSFGQDAVFLIGGLTKATKPIALFLHSGDVCVMSGDSRFAYHAVPRICPVISEMSFHSKFSGSSLCKAEEENNAADWALYGKYLLNSRINVNVRQVLEKGQSFPSEKNNAQETCAASEFKSETVDV